MADTAYDRITALLDGAVPSGVGVKTLCPAHDDATPSLHVTPIESQVLIHCHAGCSTADVLAKLGLSMADLFDNRKGAVYVYPDGRRVGRTWNKQFKQRNAPKGIGQLYRADRLPEAVTAGRTVYVVEGEKDVHALEAIGAVATCSPMGAGKAHLADWSPLAEATVVIVADRDEPGTKHAAAVRDILEELGAKVSIVQAYTGKDAADHVEAGHGLEEFVPFEIPATGRVLKVTRASEITPRATRWLWAEEPDVEEFAATGARGAKWLPLGALCLLAGREGVGKSTWGYELAGRVTRGTLPGAYFGQPRSVVIVATEDDWAVTIVPRLLAAGADLERVYRVDAVEDGTVCGLMLPVDNARLEKVCRDNDVALVLLDPLMGAIAGELDSHKDHDVRVALEPLSRLAHNASMTIVGLIHVNKSTSNDLLTRIMASRAFAAVARAVLFCVAEIPAVGPMGSEAGQDAYYLGQAKNNLGPKVGHSLKYRIEGVRVGHDPELNEPIVSSRVVVEGFSDERIEAISQAQENKKPDKESAVDRAARWLRDYLTERGGSAPSAEVKADAKADGHADRTLKRATDRLGVVVINQGSDGGGRVTIWSLPHPGPTGPTGLTGPTGPTGPTNQTHTNMDEDRRSGQSGHRAKPPREVARPGPTDTSLPGGQVEAPPSCVVCGSPIPAVIVLPPKDGRQKSATRETWIKHIGRPVCPRGECLRALDNEEVKTP